MSISGIKVVGGQMNFEKLTNKISEKDHAMGKVAIWSGMLGDLMKPTKWFNSTKNGTKVNFDKIHTQKEYDMAVLELEGHLFIVNKLHDTDFKMGT